MPNPVPPIWVTGIACSTMSSVERNQGTSACWPAGAWRRSCHASAWLLRPACGACARRDRIARRVAPGLVDRPLGRPTTFHGNHVLQRAALTRQRRAFAQNSGSTKRIGADAQAGEQQFKIRIAILAEVRVLCCTPIPRNAAAVDATWRSNCAKVVFRPSNTSTVFGAALAMRATAEFRQAWLWRWHRSSYASRSIGSSDHP